MHSHELNYELFLHLQEVWKDMYTIYCALYHTIRETSRYNVYLLNNAKYSDTSQGEPNQNLDYQISHFCYPN